EVDREAAQGAVDGVVAVVGDGGDTSLVREVLQDHALDQVVDVLLGEGQVNASVAFHFARTREVSHAGIEQDDAADRQRLHALQLWPRVRGRRGGRGQQHGTDGRGARGGGEPQ